MVDNEPRSLGVVINVDNIVNEKRLLKYSDIKVRALEKKKSEKIMQKLPILDTKSNLKIDISWDDWSCCSACCCSRRLCGMLYTPDRKCNTLWAVKIHPWDRNAVDDKFQKMMSISPYRERGVALFSTMWETASYLTRARKYKSKSTEELEEEVDPCNEYEEEIRIMFIEREQSDIKLRLFFSNFTNRKSLWSFQARWKVSSRHPNQYDTSRSCLEQGIVLYKNGDLLLTNLKSRDARRRIEVTLADGRKLNIQLQDASIHLGLGDDSGIIILWATIIIGELSFVI
ncbi:hypothetical protein KIN20_006745 [Parelaphostrongylus tenuis]|uniref:Uncharacterized protein n=1 Tax=Parelaphostrongylus tenuis TaxID=148309 RepID=A0AAD5MUH4_PARTN|nr:hypothetical protein KIN20_006745 [Parelaphostrongylus tenuis]